MDHNEQQYLESTVSGLKSSCSDSNQIENDETDHVDVDDIFADSDEDFFSGQSDCARRSVETEEEATRRLFNELEDALEREKLFDMISNQETQLRESHVRRVVSPEKARQQMENMYRNTRYRIGYHVDSWPPKVVGSRLQVKKIPDQLFNDRMVLIKEQIDKFRGRTRHIPEQQNDRIVVILENDDVLEKFASTEVFQKYKLQIVRDYELTSENENNIREKIEKYEKLCNGVFMCTMNMELYHVKIPFGKCNVFHNVINNDLFNQFVIRQTKESRYLRESSTIYVPLNIVDKSDVVENAAMMLGLRGEDVDKELLDFVEKQCWFGRPLVRRSFERWALSIKERNKAHEKEIAAKLGIRVEFWWANESTLAKVKELVKPTKETVPESARPWEDYDDFEEP